MKPGPCLSPSVIDRPHKPTKHLWLGRLNPTDYLILSLTIFNRRTFYSLFGIFPIISPQRDRIIPKLKVDIGFLLTRTLWHETIQLACIQAGL